MDEQISNVQRDDQTNKEHTKENNSEDAQITMDRKREWMSIVKTLQITM